MYDSEGVGNHPDRRVIIVPLPTGGRLRRAGTHSGERTSGDRGPGNGVNPRIGAWCNTHATGNGDVAFGPRRRGEEETVTVVETTKAEHGSRWLRLPEGPETGLEWTPPLVER